MLKREALTHPLANLSHHEYAALAEEACSVSDRGDVNVFPRYIPLTTAIRLVIKIVQRFKPNYEVDFNHVGWTHLKSSIEVRNRIVHPKTIEDLNVSDREIRETLSAFYWLLALILEVFQLSLDTLNTLKHDLQAAQRHKP